TTAILDQRASPQGVKRGEDGSPRHRAHNLFGDIVQRNRFTRKSQPVKYLAFLVREALKLFLDQVVDVANDHTTLSQKLGYFAPKELADRRCDKLQCEWVARINANQF